MPEVADIVGRHSATPTGGLPNADHTLYEPNARPMSRYETAPLYVIDELADPPMGIQASEMYMFFGFIFAFSVIRRVDCDTSR